MVKIYGLVCPFSGDIRYIGKTSQTLRRRLTNHLAEARNKSNCHRQRWLRLCLEAKKIPQIFLLEEVEYGASWQEREIAWIAKAREIGLDLTNQTSGGEGVHLDCPEAIARHKKNLAAAMAKVRERPSYREAKKAAQKRAWVDYRDSMLSAITSPAAKRKQSKSKKAAWAKPDVRARMMNRWTPEARAKQSAAIRGRHQKIQDAMTPEVRAKQAETLKATWARRKAAK